MNKQIERILICVLWLLAATLGTNFWLNTSYGFNIFSAQHWQYLAYLQAAQTPVRPAFYISLTFAILLSLGVLYVLIRPKGVLRRRIGIGRARRTNMPATDTTYAPAAAMPQAAANTAAVRPTAPQMQRPPRITPSLAKPMQNQTAPQSTPVQAPAAVINFDALRNIFEEADYSVKRSPQIGNFKPAVFAIGTSEVLWLGGIGISQAPLSEAIDRLKTIFSDTLDDIEINISGFIIAPTGDVSDPSILSFPDPDALREYMQSHKNPPPEDADGRENFNAYSEYIDTVINYMDKT
ncbi:MAG: hypothetical protein K2I81_03970 [Alphaproteobacteria bacterium]|nr:hypothetical protein [Alphaproteobacteria bacterium]